jgi:predicted transcriptional regulator
MSWPVILSGVVCVTMLATGFNLLLPLGSGLETVCILIAVASAMVFFGLVDGA